ncbi:MAG: uroporphyrinogen-III C-methyltransferase [Planctomycetota bacterium]
MVDPPPAASTTSPVPRPAGGIVYLIGAGPGAPGLLTLRGAQLLHRSDVVLYDGLSNHDLLRHAPGAEHICVGKHGQQRIWKQTEIIQEIIRHAQAGKRVARLKGGDPAVFARTAEEVDALKAASIPFEIVPGITAALAAGSYAGIPVTHRKFASAVALITGHEEPEKTESALDWDALAKFPGTLVIYMGVTTAKSWTDALMQAGKPPETPASLIRRCSLGDQQTLHCRLDEVADRLTPASQFRPPVITILGPVTQLAESMDWWSQRPLSGQTILVTRPSEQADALAIPLEEQGANVLRQPLIQIQPLDDFSSLDATIANLSDWDLVVFCSHNGVQHFLDRMLALETDLRRLGTTLLAAVGAKTADSLRQRGLIADIMPDDFHAAGLAEAVRSIVPQGKRALIVRASRGKDDLANSLKSAGYPCDQVAAYLHADVTSTSPAVQKAMQQGEVDWVTVTSSATADNLHRLFGEHLDSVKIASISEITSERIEQLGYTVDAEAEPHTIEALVEAIVDSPLGDPKPFHSGE